MDEYIVIQQSEEYFVIATMVMLYNPYTIVNYDAGTSGAGVTYGGIPPLDLGGA